MYLVCAPFFSSSFVRTHTPQVSHKVSGHIIQFEVTLRTPPDFSVCGWEDDWSCVADFTTQRVPCAAQTSQECVEDIEASFTHMFMEEVWVAFLEMVVQSSLTVEVDINTVRTHLLLLTTLCCAVHEARHVPDETVVPFPFLISCEQDVDCHGTLVFVVADIQWCVAGDLASSPSVPYTLRWMCLLSLQTS